MATRRRFLQASIAASIAASVPGQRFIREAYGSPLAMGLSDPELQPKFVELAPNALAPGFIYEPVARGRMAGKFNLTVRESVQQTGLRRDGRGRALNTMVFGYGYDDERGVTWPGRTFQVQKGNPITVRWNNDLSRRHLLPVDTSLHWAYSLEGYQQYSIKKNGVPIVTHLHGGHSAFQFDGNPEFFWSPDYEIVGPQWMSLGGIIKDFEYLNDQVAGNLWYHDHALGITRLNVYAGMAGFYFVRDAARGEDTGDYTNVLSLPAYPYELAYAVQDRMFTRGGALFYPAFPGDPFYDDFITDQGAVLPRDIFRRGGPTALAEFFGDHMVVNGKIWPKENVEPRNYRLRLLNGTDSRFLVIRFRMAASLNATDLDGAGGPLSFYVIGSDQGLASAAAQTNTLVIEPGGRYDIIFDFNGLADQRIIMENIGGDAPFGGDFGDALGPDDLFPNRQTDRIMAFDVVKNFDNSVPDNWSPGGFYDAGRNPSNGNGASVRKVALFEGMDEFGRLQPLLGVVNNDDTATAFAWHQATTENPGLGDTEEWEIYNFTGDAHPIHLHLVHLETTGRNEITCEADEDNPQMVLQHNGEYGTVAAISNINVGAPVSLGQNDGYVETSHKDMVTALPEQVTRVKATFDKPGRYVWHCHILSHEDHEMMRVFHVGAG